MKKLVLAVSALALSAVSASAADLAARPYTKAPVLPAVYDWSGFYLGLNGGGGFMHNCFADAVTGLTDGCNSASGGIFGGQLGWRTQASWLVWGFDFQGDWASIKGSNLGVFNPTTTFGTKTNGLASIAATAGYAVNNVLLYARGGGGWSSNTVSATLPVGSSLYEARWGALLGAGLEYGITPNWTIGVEYNHYFLGALTDAIGPGIGGERVSQNGLDTITAKLNYKFGGPIVAKY